MENLMERTIGSIVSDDFRTASVFEKNGIDFCCNGKVKLHEACQSRDIAPEVIQQELMALENKETEPSYDFKSFPLDGLVKYIEDRHHRYVRGTLPQLQAFLEKLCKVHGSRHPELIGIKQLFDEGASNLTAHMKKEELILFPYVKMLVDSKTAGTKPDSAQFGMVQNPIQIMETEHATEGNRFEEIRKMSNNYTTPEDGCTTYRVTYSMLKEFERDLHTHIHLENNILFPGALNLEKELMNKDGI